MVDDGSRPLFRFVAPTSSPERILPSLTSCSPTPWPRGGLATNRDLNFRLTARDGKGGVASDDMKIQVVNTGKAFRPDQPAW
jgi:hypothetical protein